VPAIVLMISCVFFAGPIYANWSEAVCLTELNHPSRAYLQSLTADQRIIVFFRDDNLMEAWRPDPSGPFTEERLVSELGNIADAWISADGLRLYFAEICRLDGKFQRLIRLATRPALNNIWTLQKTFHEIHVNGIIDTKPTLTADELTMVWYSQRYEGDPEVRKYTATRPSIDAHFTGVRELTEFRAYKNATGLHLSQDGLRIYFSAVRDDVGFRNIYTGSRNSLESSFENIQVLDGICGPDLQASTPWLTADEKTIYFNSTRYGQAGIWVSHWIEDQIDDPYEIALQRIVSAIDGKRQILASLKVALDDDRLALEALEELRLLAVIDPVHILQAKTSILRSIQRQIMAIKNVERSIAELEQAIFRLQAAPRQNLQRDPGKIKEQPVGPKIKTKN